MFEEKTDYSEKGKGRLTKHFKKKVNIDKKLEIYLDYLQAIEDEAFKYLHNKAISTADGINLDIVGESYGAQGVRNGRGDGEYRAFLQVLPIKLREAGQHEVLLSALKNLTNANKIEHAYFYPRSAAFYALVDNYSSVTSKADIDIQMQSIRAQGINLDVGLKLSNGAFTLSSDPSGSVLAGTGLSNSTSGNGGTLSLLISE